jgi:Flp pilus assembly protein TadB
VTGLISVAIVALWAAVLIPMWLRRHDDDQARRIERHRVAMGTLARSAHDPEAAQGAAARRRRVVIAAAATLGALGTVAWMLGVIPGVATAVMWLPLVAYLPAVLVSERRARHAQALRALHERRARRAATSSRTDVDPQAVPMAPTDRVHASALEWDEVFDQTA